MLGCVELHKLAADHEERAARHHREAAKLFEAGDALAAAHQAHLAHGHEVHAAYHASEAAKEHLAAEGSK